MSKALTKEDVIDIIVKESKKSREEIIQMISDTVKMMDNMVNEEGAAYVVANQLNVVINQDETTEAYKLSDLVAGQSNLTVIGRVSKIFPVRVFDRKDGTKGKVRNLELIDKNTNVRVALWDNKTDLIESKNISRGDIIKLTGVSTKIGYNNVLELSISAHGIIDKNVGEIDNKDFPTVETSVQININEIDNQKSDVSIQGKIIEIRDVYEFEKDQGTGKVASIRVKDLTGIVRITFWDDNVTKLSKFKVGDIIEITDLKITDNKYGNKELTYNFYSTLKKIKNSELENIKIDTENTVNNIKDINTDSTMINVLGKIVDIGEIREFESNGRKGQVANISIKDNSGMIRVTLWNEQVNTLDSLKINQIIKLNKVNPRINDYTGEVELSVSNSSKIDLSPENYDQSQFAGDAEFIKLSDVQSVLRGVSIKGKITKKFDEREVDIKDNEKAKVLNLSFMDEEGNFGRIAAWDENISKIENFEENDGIEFVNVRIKPGDDQYPPELTVTKYSEVKLIELGDDFALIQTADKLQKSGFYQVTSLDNLIEGTKVEVKGTIVKAYSPTIYDSCPQCGKKVEVSESNATLGICNEHNEVSIIPKMIVSLVLDDVSDTCTIKFFGNNSEKLLGMTATEAKELIERLSDINAPITKSNIEMREIWIKGRVSKDEVKDQKQIIADQFGDIDISKETNSILNKYDVD